MEHFQQRKFSCSSMKQQDITAGKQKLDSGTYFSPF